MCIIIATVYWKYGWLMSSPLGTKSRHRGRARRSSHLEFVMCNYRCNHNADELLNTKVPLQTAFFHILSRPNQIIEGPLEPRTREGVCVRNMKTEVDISDVERGSSDSGQKESPKCRIKVVKPKNCSLTVVAGFFSLFLTRECNKKPNPSPDDAQSQEEILGQGDHWRRTEVLKGQP